MGIRHYKMTFTTEGPVHVGTGKKLNKMDYFSHAGGIAVLDVPKFLAQLNDEQIETYCQFLETADSTKSLQDLLDSEAALRNAASKAVAYRVDTRLTKTRRGTYQALDVAECVKDAHGYPYIPGSSIKGMLRTALLVSAILSHRSEYLDFIDERSLLMADKNADSKLEHHAFWREYPDKDDVTVINDVMRYISVSDSEPLSTKDLVFTKKYDKFSRADDGRHKKDLGRNLSNASYYEGNELNLYREALKPGSVITASLDIDERIDAYFNGVKLDAARLSKVLGDTYDLYDRCFLRHFEIEQDAKDTVVDDGRCHYIIQAGPFAGTRCRNQSVDGTGFCSKHASDGAAASSVTACLCYLGGGVDYDSKTVVNALYEDEYKRLGTISSILFAQFPTKIDPSIHAYLQSEIRESGFEPKTMRAQYGSKGLKKGKDDHRHWRDPEFKVSPHTLKMGIVGDRKYPMGKCTVKIEERL